MDAPKKALQYWELDDSSSDPEPSQEAADLQWVLKTTLQTELEAGTEQQDYQSLLSQRVCNLKKERESGNAVVGHRSNVDSTEPKTENSESKVETVEDELIPATEIQAKLSNILDSLESTGKWAFHQIIENSPNPGNLP